MSARRIVRPILAVLISGAIAVGLFAGPATATAGSPVGHLDQVRLVGGNLVVAGWALDRDHSRATQIELYRTLKTSTELRARTVTDVVRADVNQAEHVTGAHGFSVRTPAFAGTQTWCATALNIGAGANRSIGCLTVTVPAGQTPVGSVDSVTDDGILTQLSGWALDRDNLRDPLTVAIYRVAPSRTLVTTVRTTMARPDVNASLKVTGNHGWTAQLSDLPNQTASYCAYALNTGVVRPNPELGCFQAAAGQTAGTITATSVQAFATTVSLTVSVVASPGKPTLRVTRQAVEQGGDGWSAPAIVDEPATKSGYYTIDDDNLKANTSYRYSFFLHDAAGRHTVSYQVDVTTAQL